MNHYERLIHRNFINPNGGNKKFVRKLLYNVLDQLVNFLTSSQTKPLLPDTLLIKFKGSLANQESLNSEEIAEEIEELLTKSMNPYSTFYVGHMDSMPSLYSFVGDLIASAINNNMFSLEMSPFLTNLEYELIQEFCKLFGYDEKAGGLILNGGSLANLQALIVARNHALGNSGGIKSIDLRDSVIICSEMAHVSIKKSAMIIGLGVENVITIPVDRFGHMDIEKLNVEVQRIQKDKTIIAIIATTGTTVTGNIDSIFPIAMIALKYNIWLHVDAIWGGGLQLSNEYKHKLDGIHLANSITFNPQKSMMIAKTCSIVLFKDNILLERYFRVPKDYVREHNLLIDLSEIAITGSKRADVLKLWLSIRSIGLKGYELHINHIMKLIWYFYESIKEYPYIKVAFPPETPMICIRSEPPGIPREKWNQWNSQLQDYLLRKHNTFVSLPRLNGKIWLRIVFLNPYLKEKVIDDILKYIEAFHYNKDLEHYE